MTSEEKFEELKKIYNINETCQIIVNKGKNQIIYQVVDEDKNEIWIDFNLIEKTFIVTFDFKNENIFTNPIERY